MCDWPGRAVVPVAKAVLEAARPGHTLHGTLHGQRIYR